MIFYGDETGYTNDYSYLHDPGKSYDNRWMHRPLIDWKKNKNISKESTLEHRIFNDSRKLISIRKKLSIVADHKNLSWLSPHNIHIAGYLRSEADKKLYCLFNFHQKAAYLTWFAFKEHGASPTKLYDHWQDITYDVGHNNEYLIIEPYSFCLLEPV